MSDLKATDIRIGNLLELTTDDSEYSVVETMGNDERGDYVRFKDSFLGWFIEHNGANLVKPIALTEKWFERLGFEKIEFDDGYGCFYSLDLGGQKYNDLALVSGRTNGVLEAHLFPYEEFFRFKYVHQVQNLYHAITGKELQFKTNDGFKGVVDLNESEVNR